VQISAGDSRKIIALKVIMFNNENILALEKRLKIHHSLLGF